MQPIVSYDQSPSFDIPFRFFLTAPVFGILAGFLLLWEGPDAFSSRWTPSVLALTHLLTAGFMLQVILGALFQVLPVVAGANIVNAFWITGLIHIATTVGALLLAIAFQTFSPLLFRTAAVFCGVGVGVFAIAAIIALKRVSAASATTSGLRVALAGLAVTLTIGVFMVGSLGWSLDLPLMLWADIHLGWGLAAFVVVLLAAVSYVVVPMFQITPAYPVWFVGRFAYAVFVTVVLWSAAEIAAVTSLSELLAAALVLVAAAFAVVTLRTQRQSKRAKFDVHQQAWRIAMLAGLAAGAVWLAGRHPALAEWQEWPLLFGVLLLAACFMTVMVGMLYKIVPFLVWLHLQNLGMGKLIPPNVKKIIDERQMTFQLRTHVVACGLLILAVFWPVYFIYPAGVALALANALLLRNLLAALAVFRAHSLKIEALDLVSAP